MDIPNLQQKYIIELRISRSREFNTSVPLCAPAQPLIDSTPPTPHGISISCVFNLTLTSLSASALYQMHDQLPERLLHLMGDFTSHKMHL